MKHILVFFLLSLILVTGASAQTVNKQSKVSGSLQDETAIKAILNSFTDAWNKHDAKAFSLIFAEDADFTNIRGMSVTGREEVEKFHAPMFATRFKDTNQKITKSKIRFIRADVAAVDGWWEMTGAKDTAGRDTPFRKGILNFVMTKDSGKWLIAVMHNLELPTTPQQ